MQLIPTARRLGAVCAGLLTVPTVYLLGLLGAAVAGARRRPEPGVEGEPSRLIVLVPAHNEEEVIGDTLASLRELEYPPDRFEVVVIADNCHDRTADVSREAGARVLERSDPQRHGKGWALAWGLRRLLDEEPDAEAIVFLDADCRASPNLLRTLDERMRAGAGAVQASYVVANPHESWSSALRFAAFSLMNFIRPLGKDTLGLSCGILGTGFALRRDLLARHPWEAFSLSEDHEYHLRLVLAGERVVFAPEASVSSSMPTSLRTSREQNLRWEGGKDQLIRAWTPKLLRAAAHRRDPVLLHAGVEPLVPPQSLLLTGNIALVGVAAATRSRSTLTVAVLNIFGQAAYVLGGLLVVRAPRIVFKALLMAPVLAAWKLPLYARLVLGRGPRDWVPTRRGLGPPERH